MTTIETNHEYRVDLERCPLEVNLAQPLSHQDALADRFTAILRRGMKPADVSGMQVNACMTFQSPRQTLPLKGDASGCTAAVTLTSECYAMPGPFVLTLQLDNGESRHTVLRVKGCIARSSEDVLISSEDLLPPLPELLTQIGDLKSVTADGRTVIEETRAVGNDCRLVLAEATTLITQAAPPIVLETRGESVTADAVRERALSGLSIHGHATQLTVPSPAAPAAILGAIDPVVTVTSADGSVQTLSIAGLELRSVRTTNAAAATYTAPDGSMWIADEADLALGVLVQRIGIKELTGSETWSTYGMTGSNRTHPSYRTAFPEARNESGNTVLCSHYPGASTYSDLYYSRILAAYVGSNNTDVAHIIIGDVYTTANDFKTFLSTQHAAGTPVQVFYPMAVPVESALSAEVLAAFSALRTSPGMTVSADGLNLLLRYVTDTKTYIDNKFAELAKTLINA